MTKLYVIPVEKACNAHCRFCITPLRNNNHGEFLSVENLEKTLDKHYFDRIEITGGGEPLLHPDISRIISSCHGSRFTQLYTNGILAAHRDLSGLDLLCISRAHYDDKKNKEIMGVEYDLDAIRKKGIPIKFSLLLHKSGISSYEEVKRYLEWAKSNWARSVVIRQLFEYDYPESLKGEFVSSRELFRDFGDSPCIRTRQGNPLFRQRYFEFEIEYRSCACEMSNPVLHADGKLYRGWSEEVLDDTDWLGD